MTFHESYGEVSPQQLAAYRKHNVSPADHNDLVEQFGEEHHGAITAYVQKNAAANGGMFRVFDLWLGR